MASPVFIGLTHENIAKRCEIFDTITTTSTFSTQYYHQNGKLALYEGQPTTVSGTSSMNIKPFQKVETLSPSGWTSLADHPK